MNASSAELAAIALAPDRFPADGLPEIALAGRSNVGKSSAVNRLCGRKRLARVGATPGRTQAIHFYRIDGRLYLVDLPGYGYAAAPADVRKRWGETVESYFAGRRPLKLVLHLVDARHPPTRDDVALREWLAFRGLPFVVVATKIDRVSGSRRKAHLDAVRKTLDLSPDVPVVPFSAETGEGCGEIWAIIDRICPSVV